MSIAVSVTVKPSRLLFAMVTAMFFIAAAVAFAVFSGLLGELSFAVRTVAAAFTLFLGCFGFYHGVRQRKPIHIDISGSGQIRISELADTAPCTDAMWPHVSENGSVVRLHKSSTIWPQLLLLRLENDGGKIWTVPVLPDCVSRDSFRAMSVACRWIASRGDLTGNAEF